MGHYAMFNIVLKSLSVLLIKDLVSLNVKKQNQRIENKLISKCLNFIANTKLEFC